MSKNAQVHLNDIGTVFEATFQDQDGSVLDISGATTKQLIFVAPDGTKDTQSGSFTNTGADGKLQYTTVSGDIDQVGTWKWQGYIVLSSGTWYSDIKTFSVLGNL